MKIGYISIALSIILVNSIPPVVSHPPQPVYHINAISIWDAVVISESINHIPNGLLKALILHESGGKTDAFNRNTDGSFDSGPAQLNSKCLNDFAKKYNNGLPINARSIDSILIAGKILADHYKKYGTWRKALAHYNFGSKKYADMVFSEYLRVKGLE